MHGDIHCMPKTMSIVWPNRSKAFGMRTAPAKTRLCLSPLQNFDPADPMERDLKGVEPLPDQTLARMQDEVNRILA
jgi:hypothetical protein